MADDIFDEQSLLADIEEKWGAYGAHADTCRWMIAETERLREQVERMREAGTGLWAWMIINSNAFQQGGVGYQQALRVWQNATTGDESHYHKECGRDVPNMQ